MCPVELVIVQQNTMMNVSVSIRIRERERLTETINQCVWLCSLHADSRRVQISKSGVLMGHSDAPSPPAYSLAGSGLKC
jgi:hypothetical protein